MYVLVHHSIGDPRRFWTLAQELIPRLPPELQLHQTLSSTDGTRATCLWEADSVDAVRGYLERNLGHVSTNEYRAAENRGGIVVPTRYAVVPPPVA